MENVGNFFHHLEYFTVIWPFGNVVVIWYIFPHFGILCQEKSGNPDAKHSLKKDAVGEKNICSLWATMYVQFYKKIFHVNTHP
jgi:hypothetical protein